MTWGGAVRRGDGTSDAPDNLVLTLLRAIRPAVAAMRADVIGVGERPGILRAGRIAGDMEPVKRRLDLAEA
ncbi:MAG: hypothetical protein K2X11_17350 [Acetobacteraceae bacterium]|nr:hypothetical protein [Acetobacteraceae bacterium]